MICVSGWFHVHSMDLTGSWALQYLEPCQTDECVWPRCGAHLQPAKKTKVHLTVLYFPCCEYNQRENYHILLLLLVYVDLFYPGVNFQKYKTKSWRGFVPLSSARLLQFDKMLTEKLCFLFISMLLVAVNSMAAQSRFWFIEHWWVWSSISAWKQVSSCQHVEWNIKPQLQGRTISLHIVRPLSQCDHRSQCASHVFLFGGVLCGSCCYFEETPVRLTTGCQSLLSVILLPLFGLCDCSPAGGERSRLQSLLWIV